MAALPAALTNDDLVEEFLLRLPPGDPASLVRAALVCRRWRRILANRGFRRRFCEHHHRRPPMLGFFHHTYGAKENGNPLLFTTTSSFRLRTSDLGLRYAVDACHGRVLLASMDFIEDPSACRLAVWDPITSDLLSLPTLPRLQTHHFTWKAVLLCASTPSDSCDHLDCCRGPFLVVFVGTLAKEVYAYVYSSQAGAWSHTASAAREPVDHSTLLFENALTRKAVVGNAIYFRLCNTIRILKYDLGAQEISSVDLPPGCHPGPQILLTPTEYGGLEVARVDKLRIHIWSMEPSLDGLVRWAPARVIDLGTVRHANPYPFYVVGIIHSLGAIIIWARDGVFSVDIESKRVTKLCEDTRTACFVPYT